MKKVFVYAIGALVAASLAGCAERTIGDDVPEIGGETGYMSFRIKSVDATGMSRAWNDQEKDFAEGTGAFGNFAAEDAIVDNLQANRVFFFEEDGTYHSSSLLALAQVESGSGHTHAGATLEKVYCTMVKRTGERDDQEYVWPAKCLVILNGRPSRLNALLVKAQSDVNFNLPEFLAWINTDFRDVDTEGETLGLYKYSDNLYYFTMTNSIYLDEESEQVNATVIPKNNIYLTSEQAEKNPVTVYVERVVSKVEVAFTKFDGQTGNNVAYFGDEGVKPYGFLYSFKQSADGAPSYESDSKWLGSAEENETPITLKGLITNWTINGVEYQTKLFKELKNTWTFTEAGTTDVPFAGWNDVTNHRSYWGADVHYEWDEQLYPTQFRKSFKGSATPYQEDWVFGKETAEQDGNDIYDPTYPWALDYKAYNAITNRKKFKYCLENTFDPGTQNDYHHMIMGSHVLIQARLIDNSEEEAVKAITTAEGLEDALDVIVKDKYYYSDRYYDKDTYINRQVAILNGILLEELDTSVPNLKMWPDDSDKATEKFSYKGALGGLWVKVGDTFKRVTVNKEAEENEIKATEVFDIAPAYISKGDGRITLALKNTTATGLNGYDYAQEKVNLYYCNKAEVTAEGQPTETPVQFTRNEIVSLIYGATNVGDCFKNGRMYYAVPIQHFIAAGAGNDYEAKYENLGVGDYGVLRNHWYKFTINNIVKPGIPVHDPNQPIIPNYDAKDRYIGLQVILIPWHIVDNGNTNLGY
ncbi:MAG: Mfa1 fimbrilin C-terminal domain-containing protein [Muribaculaceae bacterium]|nr:Mfa1 fimbrilin C-terminal domain-containing protein [Muribaculaceae bacterium]